MPCNLKVLYSFCFSWYSAAMSTHMIEIVRIDNIAPHPHPDVTRMEVTKVWGWQCCIGKGEFKVGDKAIYIPPDYLVPLQDPMFSFLQNKGNLGKAKERIKVRRLKGAISQGLIVPIPEELQWAAIGTDVMSYLKIERYEPFIEEGGLFVGGPSGIYSPKFDIEPYQRFNKTFSENEEVIATEKIHGSNARFCHALNKEGVWQQFCGTRTNWMAESDESNIWRAYRQNPAIGEWCFANPTKVIYGEVFGEVKGFKYGGEGGERFFAGFAILNKQDWLDYDDCRESISEFPNLKWAPLVYRGLFDLDKLLELAESDSTWPKAKHMREGLVVTPAKERYNEFIGRVALKIVSNRYLE